jgi:uncharacterized cupin superfamily protein
VTATPGIDPVVALETDVPLERISLEDVLDGEPSAGVVVLGEWGGREYGVWEMTPGTAADVEDDEFFVVLAGAATLEFVDDETVVRLVPGSVMTLTAGTRTVWSVTQTLRKVWVSG